MSTSKKLWAGFIAVIVISFSVLGYYGYEIYQKAPPIPDKVITESGDLIFTGQDIRDGQNVWQSMGGQEVGTIWGHGAYTAPDWTAVGVSLKINSIFLRKVKVICLKNGCLYKGQLFLIIINYVI